MNETALAMKVFIGGVTGVFTVMLLLQIAIRLSSYVAIFIESKLANKELLKETNKG